MTISSFQFEDIGPHLPIEGPFVSTSFPQFTFKPGTVLAGDNGAELIYCSLDIVTGYTANQGDFYCWDNTMVASRVGEIAVAGEYDIGMNVGTIWFGGQVGTGGIGNPIPWSVAFTPGLYGVWIQRAGIALGNLNATTNFSTAAPSTIGGTAAKMTFTTAVATKSNPVPIGSMAFISTSKTFTADTLTGSNTLLNANVGKWISKGMRLTGTGIPTTTASPSTHIVDINGPTITMSAAATASNTGTTVTALTQSTSVTTTSGSPTLTNIQSGAIVGFYPNQTIAGTGIPGSTTILAINSIGNTFNILMSANATATANNIAATTTAMPNYAEVFLNWPYFSATTSA